MSSWSIQSARDCLDDARNELDSAVTEWGLGNHKHAESLIQNAAANALSAVQHLGEIETEIEEERHEQEDSEDDS